MKQNKNKPAKASIPPPPPTIPSVNNKRLYLVEELSQDAIDDFIMMIDSNADAFVELVARTFGIDSWFKAYIQSDIFIKLDEDSRGECFEAYAGVKNFLERFDDSCRHFDIYSYNNKRN
jgi:hypothetical protein